jgi:large subunit ribosomal protein L2
MGIKKSKPITPGRRQATYDDFSDITATSPLKKLTLAKKRTCGRNNQGKITIRHRGGGAKRRIRIIDTKRSKFDIPARVVSIEYDPNRGARIALLNYVDGDKKYIIAPQGLVVNERVMSSQKQIEMKNGNAMPVEFIPAGIAISNIELVPGFGAKLVRGAGNSAFVMGTEGKFSQIKLPSGEIRLIKKECLCTVGGISNPDKRLIIIGNAGRKRRMGIKPTVTGKDMNPVDHPHGGGEGHQPIGLKYQKTLWGKHAFGVKTRDQKKKSNRLILQRRKNKKR